MKALSVRQPWASLICCGLKDVENRSWTLKTLPVTVLIHAGAKRDAISVDDQYSVFPAPWVWRIENYRAMGILPPEYKDLPAPAIVGVATIDACEQDNESLWAGRGHGTEYQWVMKDVHMFKEPILGVKGSLGLFEVPGIDENNLPEFVDIPQIERDGTHMRIPLNEQLFDEVKNGKRDNILLFLTDDNLRLFADYETLEPLPTETVTFFQGTEEITKTLRDYQTGILADEEGNCYEDEDCLGRLYTEAGASFYF